MLYAPDINKFISSKYSRPLSCQFSSPSLAHSVWPPSRQGPITIPSSLQTGLVRRSTVEMDEIILPPLIYCITINRPDGKSSFQHPPEEVKTQPLGPGLQMEYLYSPPASFTIQDETDLIYHQSAPSAPPLRSFPPAGATSVVAIDLAPNPDNTPGHLHRTQTLDYIVILRGEIELSLDSGEAKVFKEGEVVVQRAPMHTWKNVSGTKSARMLAVSIGNAGAEEGKMDFAA